MLAYITLLATFTFIGLLWLYIRVNDAKLMRLPPEAALFSPKRFTPEDARMSAKENRENPVRVESILPPPTGRKYIIIGGVSVHIHRPSFTLTTTGGIYFASAIGWLFGGLDCSSLVDEGRGSEEDSCDRY